MKIEQGKFAASFVKLILTGHNKRKKDRKTEFNAEKEKKKNIKKDRK